MKKLLSKAIFLYACFHIASVLSCQKADDPDCNFEQQYFKIQSLDLIAYDEPNNHTMPLEALENGTSILAEDLALAMIYQSELCFNTLPKVPYFNFFLNNALACSPPHPLPKDELTNFKISSDADFITASGAIYPAGSSLNAIFDVSFLFGTNREPLEERLNTGETLLSADASYILLLNVEPSDNQIHTFAVEVELNGQYTISAVSTTLTLRRD